MTDRRFAAFGRKGIGKVLYAILIAGIITVVLNPSVRLFLLFSDIIWLIVFAMYCNKHNRVFFEKVLPVFFGSEARLLCKLPHSFFRFQPFPRTEALCCSYKMFQSYPHSS